ncbi:hypothetical protein G6F68_019854 [Rhizopus microsporus]|nr:hypothetical protein G6F68_019854 [Rhizopus microsporus]
MVAGQYAARGAWGAGTDPEFVEIRLAGDGAGRGLRRSGQLPDDQEAQRLYAGAGLHRGAAADDFRHGAGHCVGADLQHRLAGAGRHLRHHGAVLHGAPPAVRRAQRLVGA